MAKSGAEKEQKDRVTKKHAEGAVVGVKRSMGEGEQHRECIGGGSKKRPGKSGRNEVIPCTEMDFDAGKRRTGTEFVSKRGSGGLQVASGNGTGYRG
jgi:hypothetical protein